MELVHTPFAAENPSTWETIVGTLSDGANWLGRNIQALANTIWNGIGKVIELVKPHFQSFGKFIVEGFEKGKELLREHKEVSMAVAGALLVGGLLALFASKVCPCGKQG